MEYAITKFKHLVTLWFIMGGLYMVLEGFWRGWTNISMLFVGGLCAVLIGLLDEHRKKLKMWIQCIEGTIIVLIIEFVSGMILNVWLKFGIWDYSGTWENLYGQICLPYAALWFILVPTAVYTDDYLRYKLYGEKKPQGLFYNYKQLVTLQ